MIEFFYDYGLFLLKALTVVGALGALAGVIVSASRGDASNSGSLNVDKLNDTYRDMANTLRRALLNKADWKKNEKERKKADKAASKQSDDDRKRIFVLNFKGDLRASGVESLRQEVTAIIAVARPEDEVVVCLENGGGAVQDHGLGASQLQRVKDHGVPLTVIVDKVAASGGYLMACIADRLIAAPFAIIGSIGVLAQLPNFHRFLEERGVDFEQVTAGKYKRTLTMFGKNTEADREKTREDLEDVHQLFKAAVSDHRPALDMDRVATGEHWYGTRALELGLIDELGSSDDYLMKAADQAGIFSVEYKQREGLTGKLQSALTATAEAIGLGPRYPWN